MKPAIATVCSLQAPLEAVLEDYAAGQVNAVDLWLGHVDAAVKAGGIEAVRDRLATHGIAPVAASFQGGLLTSQGDARREHWRQFGERLTLCRDLGVPVLVVAGDAFGPLGEQDLGRLSASLVEAAKQAGDAGVRLALEFDARASFPNNLQSAVAVVEQVGSPALGCASTGFSTPSAPASRSICGCSPRRTSPTCSSPTSPTCPARWRPTPTGSCPARGRRRRTISWAGSGRSATRPPSPWSSTTRPSGGYRRGSSARSR